MSPVISLRWHCGAGLPRPVCPKSEHSHPARRKAAPLILRPARPSAGWPPAHPKRPPGMSPCHRVCRRASYRHGSRDIVERSPRRGSQQPARRPVYRRRSPSAPKFRRPGLTVFQQYGRPRRSMMFQLTRRYIAEVATRSCSRRVQDFCNIDRPFAVVPANCALAPGSHEWTRGVPRAT